jgi:hypothetical protein
MNTSQRQSILDAIVEFEKVDFETPFKDKYKDVETLDSVIVAEYSVAELFFISKKAVAQLKRFLENSNWQIIPCDNIQIPLYGNISLRNVIVNMTNYFNSASYDSVVKQVKPLVYFEMMCGFWDQPKKIELGIREASLKTLEQRAELTMSHIDAREDKIKSLIDLLEIKKIEIEKLINAKTQELEILKNNQVESNAILDTIKNTQQYAKNSQDAIETLNGNANNIVTALRSVLEQIVKQKNTNDDIIAQSRKALDDFQSDAESKISTISS